MNKKEQFRDKLKNHTIDILMVILIACISFIIYQGKKHEKETTTKIQINKTINDFTNVNTR